MQARIHLQHTTRGAKPQKDWDCVARVDTLSSPSSLPIMGVDVVVVGACNTDLTAYVPRLPVVGETLHGTKFQIGFGGKGANQCVPSSNMMVRTAALCSPRAPPTASSHRQMRNGRQARVLSGHDLQARRRQLRPRHARELQGARRQLRWVLQGAVRCGGGRACVRACGCAGTLHMHPQALCTREADCRKSYGKMGPAAHRAPAALHCIAPK